MAATVADAGVKQVNLYRSLGHARDLLCAWIDFAWALRGHDTTSGIKNNAPNKIPRSLPTSLRLG